LFSYSNEYTYSEDSRSDVVVKPDAGSGPVSLPCGAKIAVQGDKGASATIRNASFHSGYSFKWGLDFVSWSTASALLGIVLLALARRLRSRQASAQPAEQEGG
jgi:hypothetical protein